jgi:hypothetical protein
MRAASSGEMHVRNAKSPAAENSSDKMTVSGNKKRQNNFSAYPALHHAYAATKPLTWPSISSFRKSVNPFSIEDEKAAKNAIAFE